MRNRTLAVLGAMLLLPSLLPAQQFRAAVGYTEIPGRLGDLNSDHGPSLRLGVDILGGRRAITWTLEGGLDRLNEVRNRSTSECFLPGGTVGSCTFTSRARDVGLSLASIFRLHLGSGQVRPYLLAGFGYLRVRTPFKEETFDAAGNVLPNFSGEGTRGDDALQGHLGGGLLVRPGTLPFGITVEGRAINVLHNYSGGLQTEWSPLLLVGVRFGR